MSDIWEFPLTTPMGELARQVNKDIPLSVIEKFKEGLRSSKKVNPCYFEEGILKLYAGNTMQAYNMGCYARIQLGSTSQLLLELLL